MKKTLYYIDCLTNLHVGSGEANFNVIDNEVERDPILTHPTIHASGIKGAVRQNYATNKGVDTNHDDIKKIFGKASTREDAASGGVFSFFNAQLLFRPLRCDGKYPCVNVTTVYILKSFAETMRAFGIETIGEHVISQLEALSFDVFSASEKNIRVEGENTDLLPASLVTALKPFLGDVFALATEDAFKSCDLPVIARNNLQTEKGNLWYEEYVPHGSRFYLLVLSSDVNTDFDSILPEDNIVQIGGNASIGNGYCRFTKTAEVK